MTAGNLGSVTGLLATLQPFELGHEGTQQAASVTARFYSDSLSGFPFLRQPSREMKP